MDGGDRKKHLPVATPSTNPTAVWCTANQFKSYMEMVATEPKPKTPPVTTTNLPSIHVARTGQRHFFIQDAPKNVVLSHYSTSVPRLEFGTLVPEGIMTNVSEGIRGYTLNQGHNNNPMSAVRAVKIVGPNQLEAQSVDQPSKNRRRKQLLADCVDLSEAHYPLDLESSSDNKMKKTKNTSPQNEDDQLIHGSEFSKRLCLKQDKTNSVKLLSPPPENTITNLVAGRIEPFSNAESFCSSTPKKWEERHFKAFSMPKVMDCSSDNLPSLIPTNLKTNVKQRKRKTPTPKEDKPKAPKPKKVRAKKKIVENVVPKSTVLEPIEEIEVIMPMSNNHPQSVKDSTKDLSDLSLPDLLKSFKEFKVDPGTYNRKAQDRANKILGRKQCHYRQNYICTNPIASTSSLYCIKHSFMAKMQPMSSGASKKSLPICQFIFKSEEGNIKCPKPSNSFSKYCEGHYKDINAMKEKLMKLTEHKDYLKIFKHGAVDDIQTTPEVAASTSKLKNAKRLPECNLAHHVKVEELAYEETESEDEEIEHCVPSKKDNSEKATLPERFQVPGDWELNKDEDNAGWMDYRALRVDDIESKSESSEEDDDEYEVLEPHEMLSTAGYHTGDELLLLLRTKLAALHSLYNEHRKISKKSYILRRHKYLAEIKKANEQCNENEECSNPDMLPCEEESTQSVQANKFPPEYITNEILDRERVSCLLKQRRISGQLGLLIYKSNEKRCQKISEDLMGCKNIMGGISMGQTLTSHPQTGRDCRPEGTATTNKCESSKSDCQEKPLPLTKYCLMHITEDKSQQLFVACGSLKNAWNPSCEAPVMEIMDKNGCPRHFSVSFPELPLSEEDKEFILDEEKLQVPSRKKEDFTVDSILASQFKDLCELEEELSSALKEDYFDSDSEANESEEEATRLFPLPPPSTKKAQKKVTKKKKRTSMQLNNSPNSYSK